MRLAHYVAPRVGLLSNQLRELVGVERVLTSPRVRATIALRVRSFLCIAPIVAETDLVAAMPSNLAALVAISLGLQRIDSPVPIPGFAVSIGWHDRYHHDPAIEWLRAQFNDVFRKREVATSQT
jgi:DNA-binding transcriptional LysR family regulator